MTRRRSASPNLRHLTSSSSQKRICLSLLLSRFHVSRLDKDSSKQSPSVVKFLNNFVSSAYIAFEEPLDISSGRSFMKIAKSIGPKILPCGTPEIIGTQLDGTPSTTTLW
ncbi:Hypothetical predicted protein, partial [Paramuricea clavata]